MKPHLFDKWLLPEARERLDMRFYGPDLAIMEVVGDEVFHREIPTTTIRRIC